MRSTSPRVCLLTILLLATSEGTARAGMPLSFHPGRAIGTVRHPEAVEISGLAVSRQNEGVFWVHNDSGDLPQAYAMNSAGIHLGTYRLSGRVNAADWEDMAIGPDPVTGAAYLYFGNIGDNRGNRSRIEVHRVAEPSLRSDQTPVDVALSPVETFRLRYPDGPRDAETLMVDPQTGNIYIVSKRESIPQIYRAAYPQSTTETAQLEFVGEILGTASSRFGTPTAGEISPNGDEILIRSYGRAAVWAVPGGMSIAEALKLPPIEVRLMSERQGESIAYDADGRDFFTVSEGRHPPIYQYERVPEPAAAVLGTLVGGLMVGRPRRASSSSNPRCGRHDPWHRQG